MTASKLWKCLYNTPQSLGNATENQSPVEGWAGKHPVFDYLIKLIKPIIIVEVGSWKGQSAITMAKSLDENKIPGAILCIDTWLGSSEHSDTEIFDLKTGQNHLYNAFRSNVVSSGYGQYIVPLARNSIVGAQILEMNQVKADLIYIDASHDYNSVYADIRAFLNIKSDNGIIFGDDYYSQFPGVIRAVEEIADERSMKVITIDGKWILERKDTLRVEKERVKQL